ncbi:hypothetical protein ACHAQH_009824 [Verticillium albo-atrum]
MEGLGVAANVIAVIDLSAKVATLCVQYAKEVAGARADIQRLQKQANQLGSALRAAQHVVEGSNSQSLFASQGLTGSFCECIVDLQRLENKLCPNPARTAMRRLGLRALKWPFNSKEVNQVYGNSKATFTESYRAVTDVLTLPRRQDPDLMIVDNADDVSVFFMKEGSNDDTHSPLASYLPKTAKGKILVTSRSRDAAEKLTGSTKAILQIPVMDEERERPRAANLLSLMSYFQAQNIPESMLHNYNNVAAGEGFGRGNGDKDTDANKVDKQGDFEDDMDVLQGYSLITLTATGLCELHSLV